MTRRLHLFVLVFFCAGPGLSQNYSTRLFLKNEGLPDTYVYSLSQDKPGFLWVSTGKGLAAFDGQFFRKLDLHLPEGEIVYASARQKEILWLGTSSGKLYKCKDGDHAAEPFAGNCKASVKAILVSGYGDQLYLLTIGNGIFIKKGNALIKLEGSDAFQISAITELSADALLAASTEGLLRIDLKSQAITNFTELRAEVKNIFTSTKENSFIVVTTQAEVYQLKNAAFDPVLENFFSRKLPFPA